MVFLHEWIARKRQASLCTFVIMIGEKGQLSKLIAKEGWVRNEDKPNLHTGID